MSERKINEYRVTKHTHTPVGEDVISRSKPAEIRPV